MSFAFTPVTGLSDTATYPTTPASEAAARQQVMDPLNQIRDYMNNSLANKILEAVIAPTLLNSWVNVGSGSQTAGYYKDNFGVVHLVGFIKSGLTTVGTALFTLPLGYRPQFLETFSVYSNDGVSIGTLQVQSNGNVQIVSGNNTNFSLSGVYFRTT